MRKVPIKNYVLLGLLAVGVVIICFIFNFLYNKKNTGLYESIIKDVVSSEIKYDDLDNYLQENPNVVLYIYDSSKKNSRDVEKNFKKLILDKDISQYIVYIEKTKEVKEKYDLDKTTPIFVAYQEGVLKEILSKKNASYEEIESFLVRNKVIDND